MLPNQKVIDALLAQYAAKPTGFQSGRTITFGFASEADFARLTARPKQADFSSEAEFKIALAEYELKSGKNFAEVSSFQAKISPAFGEWDKVLGVDFRPVNVGETPDILLGAADVSAVRINGEGIVGYQFHNFKEPGSQENFNLIVLDKQYLTPTGLDPLAEGFYTLLHEIGHALGLAHPTDGKTPIAPEDNKVDTVMSEGDLRVRPLLYSSTVAMLRHGSSAAVGICRCAVPRDRAR